MYLGIRSEWEGLTAAALTPLLKCYWHNDRNVKNNTGKKSLNGDLAE